MLHILRLTISVIFGIKYEHFIASYHNGVRLKRRIAFFFIKKNPTRSREILLLVNFPKGKINELLPYIFKAVSTEIVLRYAIPVTKIIDNGEHIIKKLIYPVIHYLGFFLKYRREKHFPVKSKTWERWFFSWKKYPNLFIALVNTEFVYQGNQLFCVGVVPASDEIQIEWGTV